MKISYDPDRIRVTFTEDEKFVGQIIYAASLENADEQNLFVHKAVELYLDRIEGPEEGSQK